MVDTDGMGWVKSIEPQEKRGASDSQGVPDARICYRFERETFPTIC